MWWCAGIALAFDVERNEAGEPLTWPAFPVQAGWIAHDAFPDGADAVADSLGAWSAVRGAAIELEPTDCALPVKSPFDPVNCVWVVERWPHDPDLLALASTWSDSRGDILAFDVEVHAARRWASPDDPDGYDLTGALTHEIGHALGLEHSADSRATMFSSMPAGVVDRRELDADDISGARFLYPASAAGAGCAHAPGLGLGWLVASLVVPLCRVRRPTRR